MVFKNQLKLKRAIIYTNLLVDTLGWSMVIPSLPYIYASFDLTKLEIGYFSSFLAVIIFTFGVLQIRAADHFGRVRMLQLSASSQLIGHALIIYAIHTKSVMLFFLGRCLPSLFKCGMVVSQALLYDVSDAVDVSRNIASLMAFSNLSFIVGPILGGEAYDWDPLLPFYLGIGISVFNLVLLLFLDALLQGPAVNAHPAPLRIENKLDATTTTTIVRVSGKDGDNLCAHSGSSVLRQRRTSNVNSAHGGSTLKSAQSGSDLNHHNSNSCNTDGSDNPDQNYSSLLQYMHIRFAFQLNNSLLEAHFSQHVKDRLQMSSTAIGRIMAISSILSAVTNGVLLKRLLAWAKYPEKYLLLFVATMTAGMFGWALSNSMYMLVGSILVTGVSSNLFLNVVQSVIAQAEKVNSSARRKSCKTTNSNDSYDNNSDDIKSSDRNNSGSNDTDIFSGGLERTRSSRDVISSPSFLVRASSYLALNITTSAALDDRDHDSGSNCDDGYQQGCGELRRMRSVSADISSDFSNTYVDVESLTHDLYGESHGGTGAKKSVTETSPALSKKKDLGTIDEGGSEGESGKSDAGLGHSLSAGSSSELKESVDNVASQPSSIGFIFGLSSSVDRLARILSPLLGSLFMKRFDNMGLVYVISLVSLYCSVLIVLFLPQRSPLPLCGEVELKKAGVTLSGDATAKVKLGKKVV